MRSLLFPLLAASSLSAQTGAYPPDMESRIVQGEGHSGNKAEGFNRGLRFLCLLPQKRD